MEFWVCLDWYLLLNFFPPSNEGLNSIWVISQGFMDQWFQVSEWGFWMLLGFRFSLLLIATLNVNWESAATATPHTLFLLEAPNHLGFCFHFYSLCHPNSPSVSSPKPVQTSGWKLSSSFKASRDVKRMEKRREPRIILTSLIWSCNCSSFAAMEGLTGWSSKSLSSLILLVMGKFTRAQGSVLLGAWQVDN